LPRRWADEAAGAGAGAPMRGLAEARLAAGSVGWQHRWLARRRRRAVSNYIQLLYVDHRQLAASACCCWWVRAGGWVLGCWMGGRNQVFSSAGGLRDCCYAGGGMGVGVGVGVLCLHGV
jgi:hypothetical protein